MSLKSTIFHATQGAVVIHVYSEPVTWVNSVYRLAVTTQYGTITVDCPDDLIRKLGIDPEAR